MEAAKFFCFLTLLPACLAITADVEELTGEPDFRWVKLHWRYSGPSTNDPSTAAASAYTSSSTSPLFAINYCEDQPWGRFRCRRLMLDQREAKQMGGDDPRHQEFEVVLKGLRMATNYTVDVIPILPHTPPPPPTPPPSKLLDPHSGNHLTIRTKGFSAKATQCLANSSVVEVETGPNFGGKISVEGSEDPRCWTEGQRTSDQTKYLLSIEHLTCGSQVHNTSVTTFIIVQENLPILTHSTRRFLVKCSYIPETFTVRAGVNLPDEGNGIDDDYSFIDQSVDEVDPSELFDSSNTLFGASRLSEDVGRALRMSARESNKEPEMWAHLVLMVILVLAAVVGLSCAAGHFVRHTRAQHRRGFMSPQEEPTAVSETSSLEAMVRDFGDGSVGEACSVQPSPVALTSFFGGPDNETEELYDLSQVFDLGYDPADTIQETDIVADQTDNLTFPLADNHSTASLPNPLADNHKGPVSLPYLLADNDRGPVSLPYPLADNHSPVSQTYSLTDVLRDPIGDQCYPPHLQNCDSLVLDYPMEAMNPDVLDYNLTPPLAFSFLPSASPYPPHLSAIPIPPPPLFHDPLQFSSDDDELPLGEYSEDEVFVCEEEDIGSRSPLPHIATPMPPKLPCRSNTPCRPYTLDPRPCTPYTLDHAYDVIPPPLLHLPVTPLPLRTNTPLSYLPACSLPHLPLTPLPPLSATPLPPLSATPLPPLSATTLPPLPTTPHHRCHSLDTNWKLGDGDGQIFPAFSQ